MECIIKLLFWLGVFSLVFAISLFGACLYRGLVLGSVCIGVLMLCQFVYTCYLWWVIREAGIEELW